MENEFIVVMASHTNTELLKIVNGPPGDYQPLALEAAKLELSKRSVSAAEINEVKQELEQQQRELERIPLRQPQQLAIGWKILALMLPTLAPWIYRVTGHKGKVLTVFYWSIYSGVFYISLAILLILLKAIF